MPSDFRWICLDINTRYCKSEYCAEIKFAIKTILGSGCKKILYVGDALSDDEVDNALDSYIFVKCDNITEHLTEIANSKYFRNILSSFDCISYLSQKEIDDLIKSWKKSKEKVVFLGYGDVGYVKSGVFAKLYGIVINHRNDKYEMVFKFCRGYVVSMISEDNCVLHGKNIFDYLKVPVC